MQTCDFFRYMEQSHLMLEQRNDSLKSSSEQNQARLLQAEQDKVSRLVFLVFNESNKAVG